MKIERLREVFIEESGVLRYAIAIGGKSKGSVAGTRHNRGYWKVGIDGKRMQAHRVIFALHHGYLPGQVDHINGVRDDNRIENLREATNAQNTWNSGLRSTNTSGVKGVCWSKQSKKWVAKFRTNGVIKNVGSFTNLEDAAEAIKKFRTEHHGVFARHATRFETTKHNIRGDK